MFYWKSTKTYMKFKKHFFCARRSSLLVCQKVFGVPPQAPSSERLNDGFLKNMAVPSGLPYFDLSAKLLFRRLLFDPPCLSFSFNRCLPRFFRIFWFIPRSGNRFTTRNYNQIKNWKGQHREENIPPLSESSDSSEAFIATVFLIFCGFWTLSTREGRPVLRSRVIFGTGFGSRTRMRRGWFSRFV